MRVKPLRKSWIGEAKRCRPLGEVLRQGDQGGRGTAPRLPLGWQGKNPALWAGLFQLERLSVQSFCGLGSRFEFIFDIYEPAIEAGFGRVDTLFQALEASSDGNGDVVRVFVDNALDLFEVFEV